MSELRLLLTGFGAFPGVDRNYSLDLAVDVCAALNTQPVKPERRAKPPRSATITAHAAELDVAWQSVSRQLGDLYQRYRPNVAIHFGVCHAASGLVLEQRAHNDCAANRDACGALPASDVVQAAAGTERTTRLPVADIITACTPSDVAIVPSQDAGRYLCNAAYFISLSLAAEQTPVSDALFVHIPDTLSRNDTQWPAFVQAAQTLVLAAIAQHQRAAR